MKVGIITAWFERGAANVSRSYMEGLQKLGHEVFIFARGGEEYSYAPEWKLPNVHYSKSTMGSCPRCKYTGISDLDEFARWIDDHQIRVTLFNEQLDHVPVDLSRQKGVPAILIAPGFVMPMEYYSHFDAIACPTELMLDIFKETGIAHLVRWGVDTNVFKPLGLNLTNDSCVFFHSAGMSFGNLRKGSDVLIKAWGRLTKHEKSQAKLIIHTQREPEVLYKQVPATKSIVEKDGIELVVGTMAPPYGYHLGNVYVYPAMVDSIGLTMPESLACGMPMITTAAAPFDEFVEEGLNGLLVKARKRSWSDTYGAPDKMGCWTVNLDALADAMRVFINGREKIVQMGQASRKLAEEKYDFTKNFREMDVLLNRVVERAGVSV